MLKELEGLFHPNSFPMRYFHLHQPSEALSRDEMAPSVSPESHSDHQFTSLRPWPTVHPLKAGCICAFHECIVCLNAWSKWMRGQSPGTQPPLNLASKDICSFVRESLSLFERTGDPYMGNLLPTEPKSTFEWIPASPSLLLWKSLKTRNFVSSTDVFCRLNFLLHMASRPSPPPL